MPPSCSSCALLPISRSLTGSSRIEAFDFGGDAFARDRLYLMDG